MSDDIRESENIINDISISDDKNISNRKNISDDKDINDNKNISNNFKLDGDIGNNEVIGNNKEWEGRVYPKILVVSYNCFSLSVSTGRTLANLFWSWDKKSIAQLYMSKETPDNDVCRKYYRVTDIDVINAFRRKKTSGVINLQKSSHLNDKFNEKDKYNENEKVLYNKLKELKEKRKIKMKLFRSIIWRLGLWKSADYYSWLDRYRPELVVVMAGENYFVDKIGLDISKRFHIPIVVYNCENYQFKDYWRHGLSGILFQSLLRHSFNKLVTRSSHVIFNNQSLLKLFQTKYNMNASIIYISSILNNSYIDEPKRPMRISYLGNINGRQKSLIEIAKTIRRIDSSLSLDVYGNINNPAEKFELEHCKYLNYFGFVSYDSVLKIISESDILVHGESFDREEIIDKRFAFSTKIGDSLAAGSCLFVYAPKSNAVVKYLKKNKAACVVTEKANLEKELKTLISNNGLRAIYRKNALKIANMNHSIIKNANKVYEIIKGVIDEG